MKRSNYFNLVQPARVRKSAFNLSHERKMSFDMGQLVPCLVQEVVPGDKFSIKTTSMIRFAPLAAPVMHKINAYVHYFYVPNRILWPDWEKFITEESMLTPPFTDLPNMNAGSLGDYLGLPIGIDGSQQKINLMSLLAYIKIWNEYYRDQNLQSEISIEEDEITAWNDFVFYLENNPFVRSWEKDYFTSALPSAQKASTPVQMEGNVVYDRTGADLYTTGTTPQEASGELTAVSGKMKDAAHPYENIIIDNIDSVTIDVNELRRATRLQRWLERNMRAGSRYTEHLLAHWGILSDDARLQRPEYIGGGKSPVVISEVLNMTQSGTSENVGDMYGHAINVGIANEARKFVKEHGYIIGIISVMPDTAYMQGLPKHFSRLDTLDYYFPEFAQLGEQEVKMKELYCSETPADNEETFGYQSRYAEYKYAPNTVHGYFRTDLEYWHLARKFGSKPQLNSTFLQCVPDTRIFAVEAQPQKLWCQIQHDIVAVRPMPFFNDPTL